MPTPSVLRSCLRGLQVGTGFIAFVLVGGVSLITWCLGYVAYRLSSTLRFVASMAKEGWCEAKENVGEPRR